MESNIANTDSSWIPGKNYRYIWLEQTPPITESRYYGLTDTSLSPDSTILLF